LLSTLAVAETVAEAMSDATVLVGSLGHILRFSAGFPSLWGISPEQAQHLAGSSAIALLASTLNGSDERIGVLRGLHKIGDPAVAQLQLRNGSVLEARLVFVSSEEDLGRVSLWAFRDMTESWSRERELRAAQERAEQAARATRDALANISHELRNPLNAIIGFGRVLGRAAAGVLSDKHYKYLVSITESGERMLRLVDDLVELRAADEPLPLETVDVASVVREVSDTFGESARSQGIQLAVRLSGSLAYARADRTALSRALTNLVSNALKFTPEGGEVEISVRTEGPRLELCVRDSGCGIALEDQPQLFDYVERVGAKHAHHMKGSGIGLALVKALVAKQGGAVAVQSALGQGSEFKVSLEVAP
jgi:signal transduction histidine kinase